MSQSANINGTGNVIIQIVGDGNRVEAGYPHLRLTRYLNRRLAVGDERSEAELLRPYSRSIDVLGRETNLSEFHEWLEDGPAISVRVLVGAAGRGKTRLALELCEQAAERHWRAGFLTSRELVRFQDAQNAADWGWNAPTLVVVDYAASDAVRLNTWLAELSDHAAAGDKKSGACHLRLLLLERHADPRGIGGWWQTAFGHGDGDAGAIERLLDRPEPIILPTIEGDEDRRNVMAAMLERAGSDLRPPAAGEDSFFDKQLSELTWGGEPLFLMMAALLASEQDFAAVLGLARDDLARAVADRELARIGRIAKNRNVAEAFARHMAALATLCRGLAEDDLLEVIGREKTEHGHDGTDRAEVRSAMMEALPRQGGGINAVEPDVVGEAILLAAWEGNEGRVGVPVVRRAIEHSGIVVAQVVIRTCQDYAIHGHVAPLAWLDALGTDATQDLPVLLSLLAEMPHDTLALRERALYFERQATARLRPLAINSKEPYYVNQLAVNLIRISDRLCMLGRYGEALEVVEEAVAIYQDLTDRVTDAYRPNLATSFNSKSNCLSALGRHNDALAAAGESTAIDRNLAARLPNAYRPNLAMSLNNMSSKLMVLGRLGEAFKAVEEAVAIWRNLAERLPDAYRPKLAMSLSNISNCFSKLARHNDALAAAEESVTIRRELAARLPDAFRPSLASSLNNMSNHLGALGWHEKALTAVEEAVAIRRDLAALLPDAYRPDLALSLSNMSSELSKLRRHDDALAAVDEAVTIYRDLAEQLPAAYHPDLAWAINKLSHELRTAGRHDEALAAAEEAVAIDRDLAEQLPAAYFPDLSMSLNNLSNYLSELGRHDEALAVIEEAVAIRRDLIARLPEAYSSDLATSLGARGDVLMRLDRHSDATSSYAEGLRAITPRLLGLPQAFAQLTCQLLRDYVGSAEVSGMQLDDEFLRPIISKLQEIGAIELKDNGENGKSSREEEGDL